MKRILAVLLTFAVFLALSPAGQAEPNQYTGEGFTYTVSNGRAAITGCSIKGDALVIPGTLGGYPVEGIHLKPYDDFSRFANISLPASLTEITGAFLSERLKNIDVAEGNPVFMSVDGVLFLRDGPALILYPAGRTDRVYRVPEGTKAILENAICGNVSLQAVVIPEGVTRLEANSVSGLTLMAAVIPGSVATIDPKAFGESPAMLSLYAPPGAYARGYAAQYGMAFGDAALFLQHLALQAGAQSPAPLKEDDPFSRFDGLSVPKEGPYAYVSGVVRDLVWPLTESEESEESAESEKSAESGFALPRDISLASLYRQGVLDAGKTLKTDITVKPNFEMDESLRALLFGAGLTLYHTRLDGRSLYAAELDANGQRLLHLSAAASREEWMANASLLGDDLFVLPREDVAPLLQRGLEAVKLLSDRYGGHRDALVWDSFFQADSPFLQALLGQDGQMDDWWAQFASRVKREEGTVTSADHDTATVRETLRFTMEDVTQFLSLPQVYDTGIALQTAYFLLDGYGVSMAMHRPYSTMRNVLTGIGNVSLKGEVQLLRDGAGNLCAFTLIAPFSMDNTKARLSLSLYRKTQGDAVTYTLLVDIRQEGAATPVILLEGAYTASAAGAKGTLRLRAVNDSTDETVLDAGLRYQHTVTGDALDGQETDQLDVFVNDYYNGTLAASLASSAAIGPDGITRTVGLYMDDLEKPLLTLSMNTTVEEGLAMYHPSLWEPTGPIIFPARWQDGDPEMYAKSREKALQEWLRYIMNLLPEGAAEWFW